MGLEGTCENSKCGNCWALTRDQYAGLVRAIVYAEFVQVYILRCMCLCVCVGGEKERQEKTEEGMKGEGEGSKI